MESQWLKRLSLLHLLVSWVIGRLKLRSGLEKGFSLLLSVKVPERTLSPALTALYIPRVLYRYIYVLILGQTIVSAGLVEVNYNSYIHRYWLFHMRHFVCIHQSSAKVNHVIYSYVMRLTDWRMIRHWQIGYNMWTFIFPFQLFFIWNYFYIFSSGIGCPVLQA